MFTESSSIASTITRHLLFAHNTSTRARVIVHFPKNLEKLLGKFYITFVWRSPVAVITIFTDQRLERFIPFSIEFRITYFFTTCLQFRCGRMRTRTYLRIKYRPTTANGFSSIVATNACWELKKNQITCMSRVTIRRKVDNGKLVVMVRSARLRECARSATFDCYVCMPGHLY